MDAIGAIILGVIQGLTEFLPVSSSGHLELAKAIIGNVPEEGMLLTVVLHFATALSTIVIFRKDIADIFKGLFQFKNNEAFRFSVMIILSMIPAAFVGMYFESDIEELFSGNVLLVGLMLIVTGGLLFLADRAKDTEGKVSYGKAIVIGVAQAIAILPGISRSGATIGTSVLLGIDRSRAARFSFLMVVPLIFGAMAVKMKNYMELGAVESATSPQIATESIVDDLEKDYPFVANEKVQQAILNKETKWADIKKDPEGCDCRLRSLNRSYKKELKYAGLDEHQVDVLLTNDLAKVRPVKTVSTVALVSGFLAAFLTGLLACTWMIRLVKRSKLKYFAFYCFAVGFGAIVWSLI